MYYETRQLPGKERFDLIFPIFVWFRINLDLFFFASDYQEVDEKFCDNFRDYQY